MSAWVRDIHNASQGKRRPLRGRWFTLTPGLVPVNPDASFTAHTQAGQLEDLNALVPVICDHAIKAEDTV